MQMVLEGLMQSPVYTPANMELLETPHIVLAALSEARIAQGENRAFKFSNVRPDHPEIVRLTLYSKDAPSGLPEPGAREPSTWLDKLLQPRVDTPPPQEAAVLPLQPPPSEEDNAPGPRRSALKRKRAKGKSGSSGKSMLAR